MGKNEEKAVEQWISEHAGGGAVLIKEIANDLNLSPAIVAKIIQRVSYDKHDYPFVTYIDEGKIVILQENFKEVDNNQTD